MIKAQVVKSTGSWYEALTEQNERILARLKGVLRLGETKDTNPVAVGDYVLLEKEETSNEYMISSVVDRANYIVRSSPHRKHARHVIAANIDQCLLIATIDSPRTSSGFIDRFLMAAEAFRIPTIIVFNKQDILTEKTLEKQKYLAEIYQNIGYKILFTSAQTGEGVEPLREAITQKTTLIFGHSGVGKSSLMNALDSSLDLRTKGLTRFANRGMHTTTFAEMFVLKNNTKIIDTPGVREFAHLDIRPEEVSHFFAEMRELLPQCKFNNCTHTDEPECAIKKALDEEKISEERYANYLNIFTEIKTNFKHWEV